MALVPIKDLLVKYGLSRSLYHYLLNRGLLPHYTKREGRAGQRGAYYLYDEEVFEKAWSAYQQSKKRGLGINVVERAAQEEERFGFLKKLNRFGMIEFVLENFPVKDGESLMQYDGRVKARRAELEAVPEGEIAAMARALAEDGFKPRSMR